MASMHAKISYAKSVIRIAGYAALFGVSHHSAVWVAAVLLIGAEIMGIVEEFGL